MKFFSTAPAFAAIAALAFTSSPVIAQDATEADMAATARYSLPLMLGAIRTKCAPTLSADGFMAAQGAMLQAKYAEGAQQYWPQAKAVFISMGEERDPGSSAMLIALPDEAVKPMMDALVPQMIVQDIDVADCATIERVLELMAPLPAENVADLTGLFFSLAAKDEEKAAAMEASAQATAASE